MTRIAGINIPDDKHIEIGLTSIFGIGRKRARNICDSCYIPYKKDTKSLNDLELEKIRDIVNKFTIEGNLRREIAMNIKRLIDLNSYRGIRHRKHLPVRGQRTRTNARTRKGPKRHSVVSLKK